MVHHWEGKELECYRLYVEERKSMEEVMTYWEERGFTPRYVIAQLAVLLAAQPPTSDAIGTKPQSGSGNKADTRNTASEHSKLSSK